MSIYPPPASPIPPYPAPSTAPISTIIPYPAPQNPAVTTTHLPTPTATFPISTPIIPIFATLTPTSSVLTVTGLLPPHGTYLSGVVADIAGGEKPDLAVLSDGPLGPVLYPYQLDQADLHLSIQPFSQTQISLPATNPKSNIRMDAIDLNQDGKRELVLRPDWKGDLIFQATGLAAWPRLMDANGDILFSGGEVGVNQYDNLFPFNSIRPVLYYAGFKQATIGDPDGDGLYEIDLSYSEQDGADTWQVIRYHWKDGQYVYSGDKFTRPAAEPVPPAQFQKWVQALQPLPDLGLDCKGGPSQQNVVALQVSRKDLNRDGRNETLLVYDVTTTCGQSVLIAGIGLAVYDADDHLTWKSDLQQFPPGEVEASARFVDLAPDEEEILFQYISVGDGSGAYRQSQAILYRWNRVALLPVWQKAIASGGASGAGFSGRSDNTVWLEDIDHDGRLEILVQEGAGLLDAQLGINYLLQKPGSFVYKWDGTSYKLAFLLENKSLQPIRPNEPAVFAPRLSQAHAPDWQSPNITQLEYGRESNNLVFGDASDNPFILYAWSADNLYIWISAPLRSSISIGLDRDLSGDFNDRILNGDDFTLQVETPTKGCASQPAQVTVRYPAGGIQGLASSSGQTQVQPQCSIEIAIPLQSLGLNPATMVQSTGWVTAGENGQSQYFPAAGKAIGVAAWYNNLAGLPSVISESDPTTWGTLIFMADR